MRSSPQLEINAAGYSDPHPAFYFFIFFINQAEEVIAGNEKEDQEDFLHLQ